MLMGFRMLAKLKGLRGTTLDIFRAHRGAPNRTRPYRRVPGNRRAGDEIAQCRQPRTGGRDFPHPEQIKGFGHVKERNLAAARMQWERLMSQWPHPGTDRRVA
jgi:indolepyruvate ferredoxin oxidoreductase